MIAITELKGSVRYINADLIEMIETNPDTQIVLNNGHRYYAREKPSVLIERVIAFRRQCQALPEVAAPENRGQES